MVILWIIESIIGDEQNPWTGNPILNQAVDMLKLTQGNLSTAAKKGQAIRRDLDMKWLAGASDREWGNDPFHSY